MEIPTFFANRVGRFTPQKLKGGGIFHGEPENTQNWKKRNINTNPRSFGFSKRYPPKLT